MGTIECVVEFPHGIIFSSGVLGQVNVTSIAGIECAIGFPRLRVGDDQTPQVVAPPLAGYRPDKQPAWATDEHYWGGVYAGDPADVDTLSTFVSVVRLRVKTKGDPGAVQAARVAERLASDIHVWFGAVADWVEVVTDQDLDFRSPMPFVRASGGELKTWRVEE